MLNFQSLLMLCYVSFMHGNPVLLHKPLYWHFFNFDILSAFFTPSK